MKTLKQAFIVLVAVLFFGAISVGGAQAGTTVKSSKSNSSDRVQGTETIVTNNQANTINTSKSNTFRGQDPKTKSINLNSSRSNKN